ncbi:MAG: amidohydrolase family protein [Sphaerochaetaceae bacterium]|nr:amidohydrolase family protein [Sphaerochaetaceae bacterium]
MNDFVVKGNFVWSKSRYELNSLKDGYLVIKDGKIEDISSSLDDKYSSFKLLDYTGKIIIPGFYDLHTHAPQNHFKGLFMDYQLLDWLNKYTFPEESNFKNEEFYTVAYDEFAREIKYGATVGVVAFSSIHRIATMYLMEALEKAGVLSYVGKVNMDRNSPDYYIEDTDESISETRKWLEECKEKKFNFTYPIITPRFIPSVTDRLAIELGKIAKEGGYPVQSHLSENMSEIKWVQELCPDSTSYADAYLKRGLLGETKTIMAHCVWSKIKEDDLLKNPNVYVAHCADSNTNIYSGIAPVKYYLDNEINVGIGSDVAGGSSLSLFRGITDAIKASKLRYAMFESDYGLLSFPEAFYIATLGGGSFFGNCGSFFKGYDANLVVLEDEKALIVPRLTLEERVERYAYMTPDKPCMHKMVRGNLLY